jgi:hypothetical protein
MRLATAWGNKWTDQLDSNGIEPMLAEWADGLSDLTPEQIGMGFRACRDSLDWPPSIAQMRKASTPEVKRPRLIDAL